ncbi:hypothetical protein D3C81_1778610 [compost metagenome]
MQREVLKSLHLYDNDILALHRSVIIGCRRAGRLSAVIIGSFQRLKLADRILYIPGSDQIAVLMLADRGNHLIIQKACAFRLYQLIRNSG